MVMGRFVKIVLCLFLQMAIASGAAIVRDFTISCEGVRYDLRLRNLGYFPVTAITSMTPSFVLALDCQGKEWIKFWRVKKIGYARRKGDLILRVENETGRVTWHIIRCLGRDEERVPGRK